MQPSLPNCPKCAGKPRRACTKAKTGLGASISRAWHEVICGECGLRTMRFPNPALADEAWTTFISKGGHEKPKRKKKEVHRAS